MTTAYLKAIMDVYGKKYVSGLNTVSLETGSFQTVLI